MRSLSGKCVLMISLFASGLFAAIPATPGWYEIPNTKLRQVDPCPARTCAVSGAEGQAAVINDWCSGAFDSTRNRLLVWGGGHNGYYGNEIYAIYLDPASVVRVTEPGSPTASYGSCTDAIAGGGQPNSRHTYDGITYLRSRDQFFSFSGSIACGPSARTNSTWIFSFSSMTWAQKIANGASFPNQVEGAVCDYDPVSGKVYVCDLANLYLYDPAANNYTKLGTTAPNVDYHCTGVLDPKRRKFLILGNGYAYMYDVNPASGYTGQNLITSGGDELLKHGYPGLVYDPVRDRIVAWSGGDTVYSLNLDTKQWVTFVYPNGPGAANGSGTYKRWNYSPASDVFVIVNSVDLNTFTFRFPASSMDTSAPTTPGNLQASSLSESVVRLTWTASSDPESGLKEYIIKRGGVEMARTTGLVFTDSGLAELTAYAYTVTALNNAGLISGAATANITTPADQTPPAVASTIAYSSGVLITFTELVDAASAASAANYAIDKGVTIQSATLLSNGRMVQLATSALQAGTTYTLTLNNIKDRAKTPNTIIAGTQAVLTGMPSTLLVKYGSSAAGNIFGLTGWNSVMKDVYTVYANSGAGGMTSTGNGSYNYQGVKGTARTFALGERIVVTWYNNTVSPITFTPKVSFNDSDRNGSGVAGTWYDMTPLTVAAKASGTTEYAITSTSAGSYTLVNINCNYTNDHELICDKVELWTGSAIESPSTMAVGASLRVSPNPFKASAMIELGGLTAASQLTVIIFDARGRIVDAFAPSMAERSVGRMQRPWNARGLSSGAYCIRIHSGGRWIQSKMLVLIR
jgi:hypothetical protein